MATVAELQGRLEALRAARDTGAKRVDFPDGSATTYRNDAEMRAAIRDLENRIAGPAPGGRGPIKVTTSKGL
jgi:O-acetyl-ADP-ribose deacetylase (regulator of RNase III)